MNNEIHLRSPQTLLLNVKRFTNYGAVTGSSVIIFLQILMGAVHIRTHTTTDNSVISNFYSLPISILRITIWLRVSKLFCSSRRASKATSPTHFRDGYSIQSTAGAMKLHTVGQNKLIRLCGVLRTSPPSFVLTNESMAQFSHNVYWIRDPSVQITFQIQLNYFFLSDECTRQWQPSILCKPKVFQKQIGHQAVETKIM